MIKFNTENEKWVWLAGLIEGEGCIGFYKAHIPEYCNTKRRYRFSWVIVITNTSKELINFIVKTFGGRVYEQSKDPTIKRNIKPLKTSYNWTLIRPHIYPLLKKIYPYLLSKTKRADLILKAENIWSEYTKKQITEEECFFSLENLLPEFDKLKATAGRKKLTYENKVERLNKFVNSIPDVSDDFKQGLLKEWLPRCKAKD